MFTKVLRVSLRVVALWVSLAPLSLALGPVKAQQIVVVDANLPRDAFSIRKSQISPDGKFVAIPHLLGRTQRLPTTANEAWIIGNALTIVDFERHQTVGTVLLDDPYKGAANPSAAAWSPDGKRLAVAHAGTQEVSIIDFPDLLAELKRRPYDDPPAPELGIPLPKDPNDMSDRVRFFPSKRLRIALPKGDLCPREIWFEGNTVCTKNYFSNTMTSIDLSGPTPKLKSIPLGPRRDITLEQKGELYFNDARLCFGGWLSCASCHPNNARSDGLNWDLLNDGVGNPKNTKSLLLSHQTGPCMALGVRKNAEEAVRAGIEHILFSQPNEEVATAIDAYLKSLKPLPSPHLVNGKLSESAQRGKMVAEKAGCLDCHTPPLFTDKKLHNVGTGYGLDAGKPFDTPTWIEVWNTPPYMHDGSAATLKDVLMPKHGVTAHADVGGLSAQEIDDLVEYVASQ